MPSPFPGMNPYFEKPNLWRGFHTRYLVNMSTLLTPLVGERYFVEMEEALYIDPTGDQPRLFAVADVALADAESADSAPAPDASPDPSAVAVLEDAPFRVTVPGVTRRRARRLVIRDSDSLEAVTVIELLSPSNKAAGADRDKYLEKRDEVLTSRTSFVEIDLLRGGRRMPIRELPPCDYYALVSPWAARPQMGLWAVGLRVRLPAVPVPLRPGESPPVLDLQAVLDRTYDDGGFARRIYRDPPDPPLATADAEWAAGFVPKR